MAQHITSGHAQRRAVLRVVGPAVAGIGLLFAVTGFASFFAAFGGAGPPRDFWCAFVGLPLLGVGLCNEMNEILASFCKRCGASLAKSVACHSCGELNDPDARFCDRCGQAIS